MTDSAAALLTVSGTVTVREQDLGDADVSGGVLTLKLVSGDGEVLAATALPAEVTTGYELTVDAALVPQPDHLRLWAMLRTQAAVWGTPELARLRDDVWLTRVDT